MKSSRFEEIERPCGSSGRRPGRSRRPLLPVRQWVLSLPKRLRYFLRHDRLTVTAVLTIFLRVVEQVLHERAAGAASKERLGIVRRILASLPLSVWSGRRACLQQMTGLGRKADLR